MKSISYVILASCIALAGCGGGTTHVQQTTETQGQQLMDLKEALDQGAITQREYDKAKEKILRGR